MSYVPQNDAERQAMLAALGLCDVRELFDDIPADFRFSELNLFPPMAELEVMRRLQAMSENNLDTQHYISFLGAGAYDHFVPSVVRHITSRSEFYTAYTPYQPEISQGTLQSIFEYQSMICALTGMDVANASHYDGATAMAEAVMMAYHVGRKKRRKALIAPTVHPEYRATVRTYIQSLDIEVLEGDGGTDPLNLDVGALAAMVDKDTACVVVQSPDFFGQLYRWGTLADAAHAAGALFVVSADPISLGLFQPPSVYGADIVIGEGQPLGLGLQFGGPYLGYFACRKEYVHRMAGRVVGETVDVDGKRGYVLTLTAREQHIRRERATSNICTNQALCALAASVYLGAMGRTGLRRVAELCYHKAHYAAQQISSLPGFALASQQPFFKEIVVHCPQPVDEINDRLLDANIIGGYDLSRDYALENHMLLCVTETIDRDEIDHLVATLREVTT